MPTKAPPLNSETAECSECCAPALVIKDPATGLEYPFHLCRECADGNDVRLVLRDGVPSKRTHGQALPHPTAIPTVTLEDLFRPTPAADLAPSHHFFAAEPKRKPRPKRDSDGRHSRQIQGGPLMVTMAHAKACGACSETNDSDVTRTPNGMFQHYVDCSDCRNGGEVRAALDIPAGTPAPTRRKRGGNLTKEPDAYDPKTFAKKMTREHNFRVYGKATKHPTVIFGLDEPGVEYYEMPAPVQDWRTALKSHPDEPT